MRKIITSACFLTLLVLFAACDDDVSYAERVETERKRIKDFISEQNIEVLDTYPSNGVFKPNQYYLDETGVYINVVDSGNGKRAAYRGEVYFRFGEVMSLPLSESDTLKAWEINPGLQPLSFKYGITSTYTDYYDTYGMPYHYLSEGVTIPLKYVGENALVNIIVPFKIGSVLQSSSYSTLVYKQLEYSTIINAE